MDNFPSGGYNLHLAVSVESMPDDFTRALDQLINNYSVTNCATISYLFKRSQCKLQRPHLPKPVFAFKTHSIEYGGKNFLLCNASAAILESFAGSWQKSVYVKGLLQYVCYFVVFFGWDGRDDGVGYARKS